MTTDTHLPLADVTRIAIHVLFHEIGSVNTARFINQFTVGSGNYTEDKEQLFGHLTVDDIAQTIEQSKQKPQTEP